MNLKWLFFSLSILLSGTIAKAQLTMDSTFSQDGYFISDVASGARYGSVMLELPDGSTLTAGCGSDSVEFRLWKYDANGNPVTSFGTNGVASISGLDSLKGYVYYIRDIDTFSNGKIAVLAEHTRHTVGTTDSDRLSIVVMKFNANGSLDYSFNNKGYIIDKPVAGFEYKPKAMVIDKADGKDDIIVGSWTVETGHTTCPMGYGRWCLSKYTINGAKDMSFNNGLGYMQEGSSVIKQGNTQSPVATIYDMRMLNGKVVIAGAFQYYDEAYFTMRMYPNGQWDNTFGNNGRCVHPVTFEVPTNDLTNAQVLQDGSSVFYSILRYWGQGVGGADSSVLSCVKNTVAGIPDASFGSAGVLTFSYLSPQYPIFIFKSDNSALFAYFRRYGAQFADQKIEFMHFLPNGTKDMTFGTMGIQKLNPRSPDDYISPSQVLHGVWTKNETGVYLTCFNKPYSSPFERHGLYKLKWDGLTPLNISNTNLNNQLNVYPNPVAANKIFYVEHNTVRPMFNLYALSGQKISITSTPLSLSKTRIEINESIQRGLYLLQSEANGKRQVSQLAIE